MASDAQALAAVKAAIREPYAWPGGYPKFIVLDCGDALCVDCAKFHFRDVARDTIQSAHYRDGWSAAGADINWECPDLTCDNCHAHIPSAYGED